MKNTNVIRWLVPGLGRALVVGLVLSSCGGDNAGQKNGAGNASSSSSSSTSSTSSSSSGASSSSASSSSSSSSGASVAAIPARIQAQDYINAAPENDERSGDTEGPCAVGEVDMAATTDNEGGCKIGWTLPGEWVEYAFSSNSVGEFDINLRLGSQDAGKRVTVSIDGKDVGVMTGPALGWRVYSDRFLVKVGIDAGEHTLRIAFTDGGVDLNYVDIVEHDPDRKPTDNGISKGEFVHPGVFSTKAELDFVKAKIQTGEQPWIREFERLQATNPTQRKLTAAPVVRVAGESTSSENRALMDDFTRDGSYLYASALLWYFTGQEKYRKFAVDGLNAWSVFEKGGMPLYHTWAVPHFINAAEIMKHTPGSGWQESDIDRFSQMVNARWWRQVRLPSVLGSNHAGTSMEARMAIAIFLDDRAKFNATLADYRKVMRASIIINTPNRFDGEYRETCLRDLNHVNLGVSGLTYAAESAWSQGVDLWGEFASRWAPFAELHSDLYQGNVPANLCSYRKNQSGIVYCTGKKNSNPPCAAKAFDSLIRQIGERLNRPLPKARALTETRSEGVITHRGQKWETLLKRKVPLTF